MTYPKTLFKILNILIFCGTFLAFSPASSYAQEFNCTVTVNTDQLEGSSYQYLKSLKPTLQNYINEYNWTEQEFEEKERIQCQIQIQITSGNSDFRFSAETVFQVQRPIYNTSLKTTTVLISDNSWQFSYAEGRSLIHDELQFEPLTGFIDYYAYIMLGYDFDTFAEMGGDPYFSQAQNILNLALATNSIGWDRNVNNRRNRNTLVTDLLSNSYQPLRSAYYTYHRLGLDNFVAQPEEARLEVLAALKNIQQVKRRTTSNYLFDIFFDTKSREIAALFEDAETNIRLETYNVLLETDQGHLSDYESLQN